MGAATPGGSPQRSKRLEGKGAALQGRLLVGVGLAAIMAATPQAMAQDATVNNWTDLNAAITAANASGDASSTITLGSSFSATSAPTAVTSNITIDTGANTLTFAGGGSFNVAAGSTLTIFGDGVVDQGVLDKTGNGDLVINGVQVTNLTHLYGDSGTLRIDGGGTVAVNSSSGSTPEIDVGHNLGETATLTISGAGTVVTGTGTGIVAVGGGTSGTLNVEDGGVLNATSALEPYDNGIVNVIGGLSAQLGTINSSVDSAFGAGTIGSTAAGFGGSLTWYGRNGFYLDSQAQVIWYDSTLSSTTANRQLVGSNGATGYGLSLEAGQRIGLGQNWSITPQAQLAYSAIDIRGFTDSFGAGVTPQADNDLTGRLGVSADFEQASRDSDGGAARQHIYGIANLYYDFGGASETQVAGVSFANKADPLWGGVGVGGSYDWGGGKYSLYGEGSVNTSLGSFGQSYGFAGTGGLRVKW